MAHNWRPGPLPCHSFTSSAWAASSTRSIVVASKIGLSLVSEDVDMDLVPSSGYNVLAWIADNDDRTQQDVSADGRKLLVRNVTTRQQVLSMAQDLLYRYCTRGGRVKTPKTRTPPLTVQHLIKNTELLTLINNCSAPCSCDNCSNSTEEGSVVGNDDMPMDDDIDEEEDYNIMMYFHFYVFQEMCCIILCSNGVLDASCQKHTFLPFPFTLIFLCSLTQGFGNFLALHVSLCYNYNGVAIQIDWNDKCINSPKCPSATLERPEHFLATTRTLQCFTSKLGHRGRAPTSAANHKDTRGKSQRDWHPRCQPRASPMALTNW